MKRERKKYIVCIFVNLQYEQVDGESILAVAYDTPIPGYNTHNCNVLRLWKAVPTDVSLLQQLNKIGN